MSETNGSNGNGNGNGGNVFAGLPAWMRFVVLLGPTATIALWMVVWLTQSADAKFGQIETRLESHAVVTSAASATLSAFVLDSDRDRAAMIAVLRRLCVNSAPDRRAAEECLR